MFQYVLASSKDIFGEKTETFSMLCDDYFTQINVYVTLLEYCLPYVCTDIKWNIGNMNLGQISHLNLDKFGIGNDIPDCCSHEL